MPSCLLPACPAAAQLGDCLVELVEEGICAKVDRLYSMASLFFGASPIKAALPSPAPTISYLGDKAAGSLLGPPALPPLPAGAGVMADPSKFGHEASCCCICSYAIRLARSRDACMSVQLGSCLCGALPCLWSTCHGAGL